MKHWGRNRNFNRKWVSFESFIKQGIKIWVFKSRPRIYLNEVKTELKGLIIFSHGMDPLKQMKLATCHGW